VFRGVEVSVSRRFPEGVMTVEVAEPEHTVRRGWGFFKEVEVERR
jgi:hypothetical protein